jgi:hypothetical protein
MTERPHVESSPGLTWRLRKGGWQARWQARRDLIARGYMPRAVNLWIGAELADIDRAMISDQCNELQSAMLVWGRGGVPELLGFDSTLAGLIRCYQTDADSSYRKLRYRTRLVYENRLKRLTDKIGTMEMTEFKARFFNRLYEDWSAPNESDGPPKIAMAHAMIATLRTLFAFGATILEDAECERISGILHRMRFTKERPRVETISAEQAVAIRAQAHALGYPALAMAQAFQFENILRQKDVIGEWVPMNEPGTSDVHAGNDKWLRGIRWSEIDENLVLRHMTSKRQKELEIDLRLAPMVVEEINRAFPGAIVAGIVRRDLLPASGPLIVCASTGLPYRDVVFREHWRKTARACGIPDAVRNMDSRAGAITESTDAGASLEDVRHAATHSDIKMTMRYSRGEAEKIKSVQVKRAAFRNNKGTA